jgi:hypothetical protein
MLLLFACWRSKPARACATGMSAWWLSSFLLRCSTWLGLASAHYHHHHIHTASKHQPTYIHMYCEAAERVLQAERQRLVPFCCRAGCLLLALASWLAA